MKDEIPAFRMNDAFTSDVSLYFFKDTLSIDLVSHEINRDWYKS